MNTIILAAWLALLGVILGFLAFDMLKRPDKSIVWSFAGIEREHTWRDLIEAIGPTVAVWFPVANIRQVKQKLIWAGEPLGITGEGFIGLKALTAAAGTGLGGLLAGFGFPSVFLPVLALLFYLIPDYLLTERVNKRKARIAKDLPSMAGLLGTAIKAGVELGPALQTVGDNLPGPLGDELRRSWREIATGRPRAASLREMAKRTGVREIERLIETIVTAEERGGISVSGALQAFSRDLLASQSRKAQEAAQKMPVKMLVPLVLMIFFPLLAIISTPVVMLLLKAL
ncbi:MAG: type II secretion system F family protein [Bacillota bacterium]